MTSAEQIDRLAKFIMAEVEGEPSRSEGAVETAIRIIKAQAFRIARAQEVIDVADVLRDVPEGRLAARLQLVLRRVNAALTKDRQRTSAREIEEAGREEE